MTIFCLCIYFNSQSENSVVLETEVRLLGNEDVSLI